MKKQYQPPIVRFENLRLLENIADVCWGYDANGYSGYLYYDRENVDGYTKFKISTHSGACSNNKDQPPRGITVDYSVGNDAIDPQTLAVMHPNFAGISKKRASGNL